MSKGIVTSAVILGLLIVAGCNKKKQQISQYDSTPDGSVAYDPSVVDYGSSPGGGSSDPALSVEDGSASSAPANGVSEAGGGRVHTVQTKDTLYSLARLYYNDNKQWKKIYEANRDQVSNPNVIKVGMKLVIP